MPKNSIVKSGDRWQYQVTDYTGKRRTIKSRKNERKKDFRLRCEDFDKQVLTGSNLKTLDELFYLWLEMYVKTNLSPGEPILLSRIYNHFIRPYLGHRELTEINKQLVYRVLDKAYKSVRGGASASYLGKIRAAISRPYNWAINSLGENLVNPCQGLVYKVPEKKTRRRVITEEDWNRIKESGKYSKYLPYITLLYHTGLRPSEALGLQAGDVKPGMLMIRRGITIHGLSELKTSTALRDIPLSQPIEQLLRRQVSKTALLTPEHWLFPTAEGAPDMQAVVSAFRGIIRGTAVYKRGGRNGIKKLAVVTPAVHYTLYDFRHTFATRMAEAGMPLKTLQAIMGHKSVTTTMQFYVDVTPQMMQEAVTYLERLK